MVRIQGVNGDLREGICGGVQVDVDAGRGGPGAQRLQSVPVGAGQALVPGVQREVDVDRAGLLRLCQNVRPVRTLEQVDLNLARRCQSRSRRRVVEGVRKTTEAELVSAITPPGARARRSPRSEARFPLPG